MNDAATNIEDMFKKSSMMQKLTMKALAGLMVVIDSKLDRNIKFDTIKATLEMIACGGEYQALDALRACNKETQAPLEVTHSVMALCTIEDLQKRELRFNTMMMLFIEETDKRMRLEKT